MVADVIPERDYCSQQSHHDLEAGMLQNFNYGTPVRAKEYHNELPVLFALTVEIISTIQVRQKFNNPIAYD